MSTFVLGGRDGTAASHARRPRDSERREHGGEQVDRLHRRRRHLRAHPSPHDHERYAHLLLVDRRAVVAPAVLSKLLAVVGGDEQRRARAAALDLRADVADGGVRLGDLAVVAVYVAAGFAEDVDRDPATFSHSVALLVGVLGATSRPSVYPSKGQTPISGSTGEIATKIDAFYEEGVDHIQLVVTPITLEAIETLAPVVEQLKS